jgi:hypothetical protein
LLSKVPLLTPRPRRHRRWSDPDIPVSARQGQAASSSLGMADNLAQIELIGFLAKTAQGQR